MRLICVSKIESGSSAMPSLALIQSTNRTLAARLAARNFSRKAASSASGTICLSLREVGDPAVADRLGEQLRQVRVGEQQPAPGRHAVGLVVEPLGEHRREVGDGLRPEQFRVDGRHAVRAVRPDDRQVRHPDLAGRRLLDQAHPGDPRLVAGMRRPDGVQEAPVDLVDDLQVPGQEGLEQLDRPLLQGLGQERVVGVRQGADREVPRLVPAELRPGRAGCASARPRPSPGGCR